MEICLDFYKGLAKRKTDYKALFDIKWSEYVVVLIKYKRI